VTNARPGIVALVSGNGSNLQAIIDAIRSGHIPARLEAVISNRPAAFALQRGEAAGIPTRVLDHKGYASREAFDRDLMALIDAYQPAAIVLAGFMRVLTDNLVGHYEGRMLNIHPSLLPSFRGLRTHERAIAEGVSEHGASVHFVTPELDSGPVIIQARVPIHPHDGAETLATRVLEKEHIIYPLAIRWLVEGRVRLADRHVVFDGQPLTRPLQLDELSQG